MAQKLICNLALNSLSIGNVSYNILRELYNRNIQVMLFPRQYDLGAYNVPSEFKTWLDHSINTRYIKYNKDIPTFSVWHLQGSEFKVSDKQYVLSFHEVQGVTQEEINIANQQEHLFFSSSFSVKNFQTYGAEKVSFLPLGFDTDFKIEERKPNDIIHWVLMGKFELRKKTEAIIRTWVKKYGNNPKHLLTLCVTNPFLQKQTVGFETNDLLNSIFQGNMPSNINPLGYLKTNIEVNKLLNSADIDLSGIGGNEGWNLPSFNATALGKWSIVTNSMAHKDWATNENSVLMEPTGVIPAFDRIFFHNQGPFNVGNFYDINEESIVNGMERAEKLAKTPNLKGLELQQKFTYSKTTDIILDKIFNNK